MSNESTTAFQSTLERAREALRRTREIIEHSRAVIKRVDDEVDRAERSTSTMTDVR